jgi:hypothetical protein
MTPYSLVEHLAKSVWFGRWREGLFAVFSVYFDASGQEEDPQMEFVSVAGFIAPVDVWIEFEKQWKARLGRDGLAVFHMSDCANYTYAFDGWQTKERERQNLLHDLIDIIKSLSRKFGCVIPSKLYKEKLSEELRLQFKFTAYVIAGRACAARVREWCERERSPKISRIQFFFERGDQWQPELKERLIDDSFPEPNFQPKHDRHSKTGELLEYGLVPFQAADVLAYLTFLAAKFDNRDMENWGPKEKIRWMLDELLDGVNGQINYFTPTDLKGLEILMRANSHTLLRSSDNRE